MPVSTPEAAELTKLLENVFRSVNIALVNELAMLCDRMKIDIWEVVEAAATKPYGFMKFAPGPGMGGHCLPVDPFYLSWKAREYDTPTEFIELAGEVNQRMPYFCVEKMIGRAERPLEAGARLEDRDPRRLLQGGRRRHARVAGAQDHAAARRARRAARLPRRLRAELPEFGLRSESLDTALDGADCAVIVTAHPGLDAQRVVDSAPLVVDFRGVTRGIKAEHLVRL